MAEDMNRVILVGRLTADAELTYTQSGYALTKFSIAVNKRRKSGDQWVDETSFFSINCWGKRGESLSPYLLKGQQIAVDGHLKQDRWDQDGQKRSRIVIETEKLQLLGGKENNQNQQGNRQQSSAPSGNSGNNFSGTYSAPPPTNDRFKDDIPF